MELTLQQLFGANAYQDGQILKIQKSDLPGLTPSANNSAESLLVAILLASLRTFQGVIEDETGIAVTDENGIPITFDNRDDYEFLSLFGWDDILVSRTNLLIVRHTLIVQSYIAYED